jgi:hypothetical protein
MHLSNFYVYVHRRASDNTIFYVGKGSGGRAWSKHRRNPWWSNVVSKHGHVVEIVIDNMTEQEAFDLEVELTEYYSEFLVNLTLGGGGSSGYRHTIEAKQSISQHSKLLWQNDEYRKKVIRETYDAEYRSKMSDVHKLLWQNQDHRTKILSRLIPVMQEKWRDPTHREKMAKVIKGKPKKPVKRSDGVVFESASAAAKAMGKKVQSISRAALGQRSKAHGYGWEYV